MPSQQDLNDERAYQLEREATINARNNDWRYIGGRYIEQYAKHGYYVPLRQDARAIPSPGPFLPVTNGDEVSIQPGPNGQGIHVMLRDTTNGLVGDYRVETNFNHGVAITLYFGPAPARFQ